MASSSEDSKTEHWTHVDVRRTYDPGGQGMTIEFERRDAWVGFWNRRADDRSVL